MRHKPIGTPRQWWRDYPELGLAFGWAVICGSLLMTAHMLGVA